MTVVTVKPTQILVEVGPGGPPGLSAIGTPIGGATASSLLVTDSSGDMASGPLTSSVVTDSRSGGAIPIDSTGAVTGNALIYDSVEGNWEPGTPGFASPMTTEGDLIYQASGVAARLAVGSAGQFLASNGTDPMWSSGAINARSSGESAYTFAIGDAGAIVLSSEASAVAFTIPPHSSVAFGVPATIVALQYGAGALTVVPGAGVTLLFNGASVASIPATSQYSTIVLTQVTTDVWVGVTSGSQGAPANYHAVVMADSPVAYYPLNEPPGSTTAIDQSGNGNNGTYSGAYSLWNLGLLGGSPDTCASFAGGKMVVPDAAANRLGPTGLSAEVWVNPSVLPSYATLFDAALSGYNRYYTLFLNGGAANAVYASFGGVSGGDPGALTLSTGNIVTGSLYHIVCVQTGGSSGTITIYVNGVVAVSAANDPVGGTADSYGFTLCAESSGDSGGAAVLQGRLQEFALYSQALTPTRVAAHYAAGIGS